MLKHKYFLLIALICTMFITSCNETDITTPTDNTTVTTTQPTTTAVTTSTTQDTSAVTFGTQSTEWERELTESEKQVLLDEMPEIVFVMSEHYENNNILGFYITSTGDVNMYDFRNEYPDEIYDIPEVYERLKDVRCDKIEPSPLSVDYERDNILYDENLPNVSSFKLENWYNRLMDIDYKLEIVSTIPLDSQAYYRYYGVRQRNGINEFVLLGAGGKDYVYLDKGSNKDIDNLCREIIDFLPSLPTYY